MNNNFTVAERKNYADQENNLDVGKVFNVGAIPTQAELKAMNRLAIHSGIARHMGIAASNHEQTKEKDRMDLARLNSFYTGLNTFGSISFSSIGDMFSKVSDKYTKQMSQAQDGEQMQQQINDLINQEEKFLGVFGGEHLTYEIEKNTRQQLKQIESEIQKSNPEFKLSEDVKESVINKIVNLEKMNILQSAQNQCGVIDKNTGTNNSCGTMLNPLESVLNIDYNNLASHQNIESLIQDEIGQRGSKDELTAFNKFLDNHNHTITDFKLELDLKPVMAQLLKPAYF